VISDVLLRNATCFFFYFVPDILESLKRTATHGKHTFIDQEVPLVLQLNLTNLLGFTVEYINRQQVSDFRFPLSIILPNELLIGARTRCKDLWRKLSEHSALLEIRE
jgi:hypothetical protein